MSNPILPRRSEAEIPSVVEGSVAEGTACALCGAGGLSQASSVKDDYLTLTELSTIRNSTSINPQTRMASSLEKLFMR